MNVFWKDLQVNQTYYTKMTGFTFGHASGYEQIKITRIQNLGNDEAMIFADHGHGFAVGGIFEGVIGPRNRFWMEIPDEEFEDLSESSATAATTATAAAAAA